MKATYRALAVALALALGGSVTSTIVSAQTAQVSATRKGVVKKIDDTTLVFAPVDAKKTEVTYVLSAETKRSGTLAVGDEVAISYHYEHGKVIVTQVTGRSGK
jgi:hypothetical protein